jgi:Holliday junction resolvase
MGTQRESKLSRKIMDALRAEGAFAFKIHGGPWMMAGLPDIIACVDGRFVALETKNPGEEANTSKIQDHVHGLIRKAGGRVAVVTNVEQALKIAGLR